jgi:CubicO group peptidase (beta-lactamase class C family)
MSCTLAEGGFLSTPSDLERFGFGMLEHRVLEPETVDLLWTSLTVNSGGPTGYGLGWFVRPARLGHDERSTPSVGHGGSTLGGRASLLILPETGMVVAAMTNARGARINMSALSGFVASYFRSPEGTQ